MCWRRWSKYDWNSTLSWVLKNSHTKTIQAAWYCSIINSKIRWNEKSKIDCKFDERHNSTAGFRTSTAFFSLWRFIFHNDVVDIYPFKKKFILMGILETWKQMSHLAKNRLFMSWLLLFERIFENGIELRIRRLVTQSLKSGKTPIYTFHEKIFRSAFIYVRIIP